MKRIIFSHCKEHYVDTIHIFVLFSFAVAQPLFDLLSRNATFFVVHRSEPIDVSLSMIAKWFVHIANHVLVEFVPPMDPMVKKLLRNRGEEHLPYNLEEFQSSFGKFFDFVEHDTLQNGRILFLCKRRV